MAPGTEFARDFCARIGPLQLGVVLVLNISVKRNLIRGLNKSELTDLKCSLFGHMESS